MELSQSGNIIGSVMKDSEDYWCFKKMYEDMKIFMKIFMKIIDVLRKCMMLDISK